MAIYNVYICVLTLFIVQSCGNGEIVIQPIVCDLQSNYWDSDFDCPNYVNQMLLSCNPLHVIMITNITTGYFNETEHKIYCQRVPENICTVEADEENDLGYFYRDTSACVLSRTCFTDTPIFQTQNRNDKCTSVYFLAYTEYVCVSDSSIINMTKPGMNHNLESFSLAYREDRYLEIDDHFYCSCEVTADDDDDVYIYTTVLYLRLNVGRYNTSVTIYSRDQTVRYDANNTDMTHVDIRGYKYLVNKQLKQTKGPIHLVYEGDQLQPDNDKIWVDFKASQGRVKANCSGCQMGYFSPPIFDSKGPAPPTSSDIYKTALISVLGIIAVLGLVTVVGVVVYRKRKCFKDKKETTANDVPATSGPVSDVPTASSTVSYVTPVSRTVSGSESELYDTINE